MNMNKKLKIFIFIYCACFVNLHAKAILDDNSRLKAGEKSACANWIDNWKINEILEVNVAVAYLAKRIGGVEGAALRSKAQGYLIKAVHAAKKIGGAEGLGLLSKLARSRDEDVQLSIVHAASLIGGEGGIALLKQLARSKSDHVKIWVALTVGQIGGEEEIAFLKQLAKSRNKYVRRAVAESAGRIDGGGGLVHDLIWDKDRWVGTSIAHAAGRIGMEWGISVLEYGLAGGKVGSLSGMALLKQLAKSNKDLVRMKLALVMKKICGAEAEALLKKLKDESPYLERVIAIEELEENQQKKQKRKALLRNYLKRKYRALFYKGFRRLKF